RDEPFRRSAAPRRVSRSAVLGARRGRGRPAGHSRAEHGALERSVMQHPLISRREFLCGAAAGITGVALGGAAPQATRTVSDLAALKEALESTANPGDVLLLRPGVYRKQRRGPPA